MTAEGLKERLESFIESIEEEILTNMPSKGCSETECQRQYLINRLNDFSYAVNGISDEDLIEDLEEEE